MLTKIYRLVYTFSAEYLSGLAFKVLNHKIIKSCGIFVELVMQI